MPLLSRRRTQTIVAALAIGLVHCAPAFSETLPWLAGPQAAPAQPTPAQPAPAQHTPAQPSSKTVTHSKTAHHSTSSAHHQEAEPLMDPEDQRKADDRHLDDLAVLYSHIHATDKDAVAKLKKLQTQVSASISKLKKRNYDSADILKDTQFLSSRISAQIKKIQTVEATAQPAKEEAPSAGGKAQEAAPPNPQ
jgi:hypothetical protein